MRIDERIESAMAETGTPGVALAVVREGAVVHARGFGVTSVGEGGTPVTERTLFQIGSTTKPLTGTLIMRLVEQGLLELDVPVRVWLPDVQFSVPGAADAITLRMLLSHTAGLPWDQISPTRVYGRRDPGALGDWVRDELPDRELVAPPGALWSYSNPGINLAARVAEVAAQRWYTELMQELVFDPLGMERTTFDPTVAMTWPLALSHARGDAGEPRVQHRAADNVAQYPSAFAYSTVLDLARFARMQLDGGEIDGQRVLSRESVGEMQRPQADRREGEATHYGLTLSINGWRGLRRIGHMGGILGYGCELAFVHGTGAAVVLLYNHGAFAEVVEGIANKVLAELLELPDDDSRSSESAAL
jgi:CubicO group peptidase (beta-lactamase class C family)